MKRLLSVFLLALMCSALGASECVQRDTSALFRQLDGYLASVDRLSPPAACVEADFIISSVKDSVLRNEVAARVFRHFRDSKVMGSENVAVYIYDGWFATYKALFDDIDEFESAGLYAYVNRRSLIGCKAPELTMDDMEGNPVTLPSGPGRKSVIYFYSADCPKCLLTSMKLVSYLDSRNPDVDFYAVYTGDDIAVWQAYVAGKLKISASSARVFNLRGGDTDFVSAYGVIQTPRLFLVDENGVVAGRNLDVDALSVLLH